MLRRYGFGMRSQEMMQDMQQGPDMAGIVAALGFPDVVGDHPPDLPGAAILVREILSVSDRCHLRQMLMLGDGKDLFFGEITKAETIFERNHGSSKPRFARVAQAIRRPYGATTHPVLR